MSEVGAFGPDQQRADEYRMPGELVINAGLDAISRIGAAIEVLCKQSLAPGVGNEIVEQQLELFGGEAAVLFPPYGLLGLSVGDDEFIFGAAAGMDPRFGAECATLDQKPFAIGDRMLD